MPVLLVDDATWSGCEDRKERKVKKTAVTKNAAIMMTLGGLMM
jgi:hypothetical protein